MELVLIVVEKRNVKAELDAELELEFSVMHYTSYIMSLTWQRLQDLHDKTHYNCIGFVLKSVFITLI